MHATRDALHCPPGSSDGSAEHHRHDAPVVYLAEDDDDIRETLSVLFAHDGFEVRAAPDGAQLFDWLFRELGPGVRLPDVIVTDHRMPGYCALDILECLAEIQWDIPVIVITAYGAEVRSLALAYGALDVFEKPFDPDELRGVAMGCVEWGPDRARPQVDELARRRARARASSLSAGWKR